MIGQAIYTESVDFAGRKPTYMTAAELRKAGRAHKRAAEQAEEAQATLYRAIREHHARGMTMRAIAAEVGLSFQRVAQILKAD